MLTKHHLFNKIKVDSVKTEYLTIPEDDLDQVYAEQTFSVGWLVLHAINIQNKMATKMMRIEARKDNNLYEVRLNKSGQAKRNRTYYELLQLLKGVIQGSIKGVIEGDARSLDYSSYPEIKGDDAKQCVERASVRWTVPVTE